MSYNPEQGNVASTDVGRQALHQGVCASLTGQGSLAVSSQMTWLCEV